MINLEAREGLHLQDPYLGWDLERGVLDPVDDDGGDDGVFDGGDDGGLDDSGSDSNGGAPRAATTSA
jgi:hypothetical protein